MVARISQCFRTKRSSPSGSVLLVLIILLIVAAGIGAMAWFYFQRERAETTENILTRPVFKGPYEHIVLEQGQVESSSSVEIRCEVKSRSAGGTEILWVVDEGTHVKKADESKKKKPLKYYKSLTLEDLNEEGVSLKDDMERYKLLKPEQLIKEGVLVLLDSSALEQDLVQQGIVCNTSEALVVQAENTLRAAEIPASASATSASARPSRRSMADRASRKRSTPASASSPARSSPTCRRGGEPGQATTPPTSGLVETSRTSSRSPPRTLPRLASSRDRGWSGSSGQTRRASGSGGGDTG